jgi:plasmid stabilization system protein ParE
MNLRITPRALAEAKRIKTWWRRHRLGNPALFENELDAALERIVGKPDIGSRYRGTALKVPVLRLLMPRTNNHVDYAVEHNTIVVLSVWGAPKGEEPQL